MDTAYVDRSQALENPPPPSMISSAPGLEYASPGIGLREPFDWPGAIRQFIFSLGVGLLVFAIFNVWGDRPWNDDGCAWAGIGAGLVALSIRWPGHIGRRRERA